jgi:hypothetical protein
MLSPIDILHMLQFYFKIIYVGAMVENTYLGKDGFFDMTKQQAFYLELKFNLSIPKPLVQTHN